MYIEYCWEEVSQIDGFEAKGNQVLLVKDTPVPSSKIRNLCRYASYLLP